MRRASSMPAPTQSKRPSADSHARRTSSAMTGPNDCETGCSTNTSQLSRGTVDAALRHRFALQVGADLDRRICLFQRMHLRQLGHVEILADETSNWYAR